MNHTKLKSSVAIVLAIAGISTFRVQEASAEKNEWLPLYDKLKSAQREDVTAKTHEMVYIEELPNKSNKYSTISSLEIAARSIQRKGNKAHVVQVDEMEADMMAGMAKRGEKRYVLLAVPKDVTKEQVSDAFPNLNKQKIGKTEEYTIQSNGTLSGYTLTMEHIESPETIDYRLRDTIRIPPSTKFPDAAELDASIRKGSLRVSKHSGLKARQNSHKKHPSKTPLGKNKRVRSR